ncbi:MAG: hypothetical protein JW844_07715, partial [Candidatus Omnitrophica bacterium]|nr:hypothetical protein [Candidatus Omnitrophota bacterium]
AVFLVGRSIVRRWPTLAPRQKAALIGIAVTVGITLIALYLLGVDLNPFGAAPASEVGSQLAHAGAHRGMPLLGMFGMGSIKQEGRPVEPAWIDEVKDANENDIVCSEMGFYRHLEGGKTSLLKKIKAKKLPDPLTSKTRIIWRHKGDITVRLYVVRLTGGKYKWAFSIGDIKNGAAYFGVTIAKEKRVDYLRDGYRGLAEPFLKAHFNVSGESPLEQIYSRGVLPRAEQGARSSFDVTVKDKTFTFVLARMRDGAIVWSLPKEDMEGQNLKLLGEHLQLSLRLPSLAADELPISTNGLLGVMIGYNRDLAVAANRLFDQAQGNTKGGLPAHVKRSHSGREIWAIKETLTEKRKLANQLGTYLQIDWYAAELLLRLKALEEKKNKAQNLDDEKDKIRMQQVEAVCRFELAASQIAMGGKPSKEHYAEKLAQWKKERERFIGERALKTLDRFKTRHIETSQEPIHSDPATLTSELPELAKLLKAAKKTRVAKATVDQVISNIVAGLEKQGVLSEIADLIRPEEVDTLVGSLSATPWLGSLLLETYVMAEKKKEEIDQMPYQAVYDVIPDLPSPGMAENKRKRYVHEHFNRPMKMRLKVKGGRTSTLATVTLVSKPGEEEAFHDVYTIELQDEARTTYNVTSKDHQLFQNITLPDRSDLDENNPQDKKMLHTLEGIEGFQAGYLKELRDLEVQKARLLVNLGLDGPSSDLAFALQSTLSAPEEAALRKAASTGEITERAQQLIDALFGQVLHMAYETESPEAVPAGRTSAWLEDKGKVRQQDTMDPGSLIPTASDRIKAARGSKGHQKQARFHAGMGGGVFSIAVPLNLLPQLFEKLGMDFNTALLILGIAMMSAGLIHILTHRRNIASNMSRQPDRKIPDKLLQWAFENEFEALSPRYLEKHPELPSVDGFAFNPLKSLEDPDVERVFRSLMVERFDLAILAEHFGLGKTPKHFTLPSGKKISPKDFANQVVDFIKTHADKGPYVVAQLFWQEYFPPKNESNSNYMNEYLRLVGLNQYVVDYTLTLELIKDALQSGNLVDIGAGRARAGNAVLMWSDEPEEKGAEITEVISLDVQDFTVDAQRDPRNIYKQIPYNDLTLPNNTAKNALIKLATHHMSDPDIDSRIAQAAEILEPGGRLIVVDTLRAPFTEVKDDLHREMNNNGSWPQGPWYDNSYKLTKDFLEINSEQQKQVLFLEDYFGHFLTARRMTMPMPANYLELDDLQKRLRSAGLKELPHFRRVVGKAPIISQSPPMVVLVYEKPLSASPTINTIQRTSEELTQEPIWQRKAGTTTMHAGIMGFAVPLNLLPQLFEKLGMDFNT